MTPNEFKILTDHADAIPELGYGGKSIKEHLKKYAEKVSSGNYIVDIGPYLGSTTAYLAIGVMRSGSDVKIHAYDKWILYPDMNRKAKKFNGLEYKDNAHFDDAYKFNIMPFSSYVTTHKCDVLDAQWYGGDIELFVDDIGNGKDRTDHLLRTFSPYFIAGKTHLLYMDFYYYETKAKEHPLSLYQRDFMKANKSVFEFIGRPQNSRTAIFLYRGGEIEYNVPGKSYNEKEYK